MTTGVAHKFLPGKHCTTRCATVMRKNVCPERRVFTYVTHFIQWKCRQRNV